MFDFTALCVEGSNSLSYIDIGIAAVVLLFAVPAAFKGLCGNLERGCFGQFLGIVVSLAMSVIMVFGIKGVGPFMEDFTFTAGLNSTVSAKVESLNPRYSARLFRDDNGILCVAELDGTITSVARMFIPVESPQTDQIVATVDKAVSESFSDETIASLGRATVGSLIGEFAVKLALFLACFIICIIVCMAFSYVFGILKNSLDDSDSTALKIVDKFFGGLAGILMGAIIAAIITAILAVVVQFKPIDVVIEQFESSTIAKYVYDFVASFFAK